MKIARLSVLFVTIVCGCGSSGGATGTGGSSATGGSNGTGGAAGGSATGGAAGGSATGGAAGGTATGGAGGGSADCPFQGTWKAVQYACGTDALTTIPPQVSFMFTLTGTDAMFTQVSTAGSNTCTNSSSSSGICSGDMVTFGSGTVMCTPANCLSKNQCGSTAAPIVYTFTQADATHMTTVTPDTTPLTTCTDQGKSNPITFTWQKQ